MLLSVATWWLLLAIPIAHLSADTSQPRGQVSGNVVDEVGAAIPGTVVLIKGKRYKRKVVVNEDGFYSVELPSGSYRMQIDNPVYRPFRRKLHVLADRTVTQDIVLVAKGKHVIVN